MGHPLIEEFCRAHALRPDFFRRCQRVFRDEVQPQLDELPLVKAELAEVKATLEKLQEKSARRRTETAVSA